MNYYNIELYHHGIKGQKWGVRRYKNKVDVNKKDQRKKIFKKIAMVDDNNQGEYNDAHDPIIIFRAHEALKNIGDPKHPHYLTYEEIVNNYNDVEAELKKKGQEIFL